MIRKKEEKEEEEKDKCRKDVEEGDEVDSPGESTHLLASMAQKRPKEKASGGGRRRSRGLRFL